MATLQGVAAASLMNVGVTLVTQGYPLYANISFHGAGWLGDRPSFLLTGGSSTNECCNGVCMEPAGWIEPPVCCRPGLFVAFVLNGMRRIRNLDKFESKL